MSFSMQKPQTTKASSEMYSQFSPGYIYDAVKAFKAAFYHGTYSTEDGQIVYKVVTPNRFTQKAYIYRNILNLTPPAYGDSKQSPTVPKVDLEEDGNKYTKIGVVNFNSLTPSIITIGDKSFNEHEMFGSVDSQRYYRDPRTFFGPDGKNYVWDISKQAQLLRSDPECQTEITSYETRYYAPVNGPLPVLNITADGELISDFILITWVFAQRLVRVREQTEQQPRVIVV